MNQNICKFTKNGIFKTKRADIHFSTTEMNHSRYGKTFSKILVANRGEIACRIIRTARAMGIETVAVYSDADVNSRHVKMAHQSVNIGASPAKYSYLEMNAVVAACKSTGAEAVHPGYGFLAENAAFVHMLNKNNIEFIGPSAKSIEDMGDKIASKIIAKNAGLDMIPGFDGVILSHSHAKIVANTIGFPVILKASAGGGGKGMRIVYRAQDIQESFRIATSEAVSCFGDSRLLIEKYIEDPKHIEIQLLGDQSGNIIYFPERECSIQRRNQKVIEESPSLHIDTKLWNIMGHQAVNLAKSVGYYSAGTCEFLLDTNNKHYFLELNTRLQVEHPITESITGIDLVEHMIRIAAGQTLKLEQKDVKQKGWVIESRIYAEDPKTFLPSTGTITRYKEPDLSMARCDSGIIEGSEITRFYDPLICKVSVHASTRSEAINQMKRAIDEFCISGVKNNVSLLWKIMDTKNFQNGLVSTSFLQKEHTNIWRNEKQFDDDFIWELICVSAYVDNRNQTSKFEWIEGGTTTCISHELKTLTKFISLAGTTWPVNVTCTDGQLQVSATNRAGIVECQWDQATGRLKTKIVAVNIGTKSFTALYIDPTPLGFNLKYHGIVVPVKFMTDIEHKCWSIMKTEESSTHVRLIKSPMPGLILSFSVSLEDVVEVGQDLFVMESMKMQVL